MNKVKTYNTISVEIASLLGTLGHPARVQILLHLAKFDGCTAGSIAEHLPLEKSTISEHLKKLKHARLIHHTQSGNCLKYSLDNDFMESIQNNVIDFLEQINALNQGQVSCSLAGQSECCPYINTTEIK